MQKELSDYPNRRTMLGIMAASPLATMMAVQSKAEELPEERDIKMKPNILLIHCHDLGQYLQCYGVPTVQTPHLDQFATEGVLFERAFCTAPQCSPSRASMFTGRYPHNNGVMGLAHANFAWDLHPEEKHLGQLLKESGYRTAGVGVLHETNSGWQRCGFDSYDPQSFVEPAVDKALERLENLAENNDSPFYMQVGFIEPHRLPQPDRTKDMGFIVPGIDPDSEKGIWVPGYLDDTSGTLEELAELQGLVHFLDAHVGRLLDGIDELGLRDNTLVIFVTDHGVAMPRAKCSLYDPGLEIALMLRLPAHNGWHGGKRIKHMISNMDMLPSLMELIGEPVPANVQGKSFAPLLEGNEYEPHHTLFGEITYHDYYDPRRCIRTEKWKLIANFSAAPAFMDPSQSWRPRADTVTPANHAHAYHTHFELYDLENDPWEQENLVGNDSHSEIRDTLMQQLFKHLHDTQDTILDAAVTSPMHTSVVQKLRDAGTTV